MTKLTVDSKSFVEAIQWATKSFDAKDDKAYVALFVDEQGMGYLSHANQTSYLRSPFTILDADLDGKSEVKIALDGRFIQRLSSALTDGPVELSDDGNSFVLKSKAGKFTIPTYNARVAAAPPIVVLGEVEDAEYFDALQRLAKLTDPASAGLFPVLGTVDVAPNADDNTITLMATDRYALGEIKLNFTPADGAAELLKAHANLLLPYESAVLVAPSKAAGATELVFEETGGKFGYSFADGRIALFSLKETAPLLYEKLKEGAQAGISNSVTLATKDLQKAIATISTLDWDSNDIFMEITEDKLIIHDKSSSNRLEVETEAIEVEESHSIKFVRSVINEAFSPVATAKMKLRWSSDSKPFVLESILDNGEVADNVFVLAIPSA